MEAKRWQHRLYVSVQVRIIVYVCMRECVCACVSVCVNMCLRRVLFVIHLESSNIVDLQAIAKRCCLLFLLLHYY